MRQTVALSLRLLTLGALLCAAAPLQAATDGSGEFVGRRGSSFYVGNKPFRHVGGNFSRILYQPWWQVLRELESQGEARQGSRRMIEVLLWWVENGPGTEELAAFLKTSVAAAKERKKS